MLCTSCSQSIDTAAKYCSCCGRLLYPQAPYPEGPLMRLQTGRMIAGVCAGFAHTYRLDVTVTRLVVCLLALFSCGTVFVAYIIAWLLMPQAPLTATAPITTGVVTS